MKKTVIILLIFVSLAVQASAQRRSSASIWGADYRDVLQLGVKSGVNYSAIYDVKGVKFSADPGLGLATGLFVAIPFGKEFGFQPEILISRKGFHARGSLKGDSYEFRRTTTFADIPLPLSYKPVRYLNILAGPQYSYLINEEDMFSKGAITFEQETEFKHADVTRNYLGFILGADFYLNHFVISIRSGWDISSNNGSGTDSSPGYRNAWYQATLGYRLVNDR